MSAARAGMTDEWRDEDAVDLRAIMAQLWAHKWWIIASIVIFTALFVTIAKLTTPIYRATTVLVSTSSERNSMSGSLGSALGSVGGLASLAGISIPTSDSSTQEAMAVLDSREFTERFIADFKLMPKLFPKLWDASTGRWKVPVEQQPTPAKAFKYFDTRIRTVEQDKKTGLVTVNIDWREPKEAARWGNELVSRLNEEMRKRAI